MFARVAVATEAELRWWLKHGDSDMGPKMPINVR